MVRVQQGREYENMFFVCTYYIDESECKISL